MSDKQKAKARLLAKVMPRNFHGQFQKPYINETIMGKMDYMYNQIQRIETVLEIVGKLLSDLPEIKNITLTEHEKKCKKK